MQAMLDFILPSLKGGKPVQSYSVELDCPEGFLAEAIAAVQKEYDAVEIGVYPLIKNGRLASSIVARTNDDAEMAKVTAAIGQMIKTLGIHVLEEDAA